VNRNNYRTELGRLGSDYKCKKCGFTFPKKGANISGGEGYPYGHHVHCPNCDAVVAQFVKVAQ